MKKVLASLTTFVLTAALLAGCAGSTSTPTTASGSTLASSSTPGAATANTNPIKFNVATINFGEEPTGRLIQEEWLKKTSEGLGGRKIDIDFQYINIADYAEKLNIMLAGGDLPDAVTIFGIDSSEVNKYGEQGLLVDLNEYKDIMPNYTRVLKEDKNSDKVVYAANGGLYGFYHVVYAANPPAINLNMGTGVRGDVLEKLNQPYPTTQDEFYEVAKALKAKYPDQYPITLIEEWVPIEDTLFKGNHTSGSRYYNGEKFVYGPLEDSYKEALQTLNKWYAEKLISPDYFAHTSAEGLASVANGTALMAPNIYSDYSGIWKDQYPDQKWVIIPNLKNPKYGEPWARFNAQDTKAKMSAAYSVVVSNKSKVKEDVISVLDMKYDPGVTELLTWGVEGVTFQRKTDGSRELLPKFKGAKNMEELISYGVPAAGRARSGIFPEPQDIDMLWVEFGASDYIFNGTKVVESPIAQFARDYPNIGIINPNTAAPNVQLSADELQKYANIMTAVDTFAKEAMVQFIKGERSFADWDKYLAEINAVGDINKALDIYNSKL